MITQENKAKWLEALRSGDYPKMKGAFFSPDFAESCALGVLLLATHDMPTEEHPRALLRNMGIDSALQSKIVTMNDDPGNISFEEIADWIEDTVPTS